MQSENLVTSSGRARRIWIGVALCAVATTVGAIAIAKYTQWSKSTVRQQRFGKLLGGQQSIANIRAAQRVIAYRVTVRDANYLPERLRQKVKPGVSFDGLTVLDGPVEVESDAARRLSDLLLNVDSYAWDTGKACKFDPGVGLRFEHEGFTTDVLLCFTCGDVAVSQNGKLVGGITEHVGMKTLFLPICKKLFPDDEVLQSLK